MNFRRYSENLVKRVKQNVDVHIQYRNRKGEFYNELSH